MRRQESHVEERVSPLWRPQRDCWPFGPARPSVRGCAAPSVNRVHAEMHVHVSTHAADWAITHFGGGWMLVCSSQKGRSFFPEDAETKRELRGVDGSRRARAACAHCGG